MPRIPTVFLIANCAIVCAILSVRAATSAAAPANARPILLPIDEVGFTVGQTDFTRSFKAVTDSFVLYGGTGEGDFQDASGAAARQGWLGVDRTDSGALPAVGEFSKVFGGLSDLDPCASNPTPQMTFLDDGSSPSNLPGQSTGGEISVSSNYGLPGGWVVNYSGGLSGGLQALRNEVWSPEISYDDDSTTVDDGIVGGLSLQYDAWMDLPLANGMFHTWAVRSISTALGAQWSGWRDRGYVYYSETPHYVHREIEVGDLLVDSPGRVQIALGVTDLADVFGLPGTDATPSPWLDNVRVVKHQVIGPTLVVDDIDRFADSFAHSGAAFDSTSLAAQVTRVDTGRDINPSGLSVLSGDSMVVRVVATQPGVSLAGPPTMTWYLRANPLFDRVRVLPTTAISVFPGVWKGTLSGLPSTDATGTPVPDTWYFDLPDGPPRNSSLIAEPVEDPFFFPGDRLWAYVGATDTNGDTNHWLATPQDPPQDGGLCGQGLGKGGDPNDPNPPKPPEPPKPKPIPNDSLPGIWEVPQKAAVAGTAIHVPHILVWDDAIDAAELELFERALAENGVLAGRDYDVYSTFAPQSGLSNGLGATDGVGASAAQLSPYRVIFYLGGHAPAPLISDGSGSGANDKGDDLGVLESWLDQAGDRALVSFADHLGSAMTLQGTSTETFLRTRLALSYLDDDVSDALGGVVSPVVVPSATAIFATQYVVWGGCGAASQSDEVDAQSALGALAGHGFDNGSGVVNGVAASVLYDTTQTVATTSYRRAMLSFPYAFARIRDVVDQPASSGAKAARSRLMAEVLGWLGESTTGGPAVNTPQLPRGIVLEAPAPNPFNPRTTVALSTDRSGDFDVAVFDLRGRRVDTLVRGSLARGRHELIWTGTDASGQRVASGVYLLQVRGPEGWLQVRRLSLVK